MTEAGDYIVLENQNYLLPPVVEHQNGVVKKQFKLYNGESNKHSLDLFLPRPVLAARRDLNFRAPSGQTEAAQSVPVVVFVHGGGWRRGDRRAWTHTLSQADTNIFLVLYTKYWNIYQNVGESLSRQGVACAVISYPLSDVDFPWNLIETLISWFLSTSVLLLPMLVAVLLATYFQGITSSSADHKGSWCEQHHSDVYTASILMVTGCQAITWSIIQYHRKDRYDFLPKFLPVLLVFFFITMSCVHFVSCHLYQEVLLVNAMCLIVTPAVLFYYRHISTSGKVKHPGHALAVAKAIHWVAQYGRLTKFYDPELLFLMGHSAGAHLVALVTGDRRYLEDKANDGHSVAVKVNTCCLWRERLYIYIYISGEFNFKPFFFMTVFLTRLKSPFLDDT